MGGDPKRTRQVEEGTVSTGDKLERDAWLGRTQARHEVEQAALGAAHLAGGIEIYDLQAGSKLIVGARGRRRAGLRRGEVMELRRLFLGYPMLEIGVVAVDVAILGSNGGCLRE